MAIRRISNQEREEQNIRAGMVNTAYKPVTTTGVRSPGVQEATEEEPAKMWSVQPPKQPGFMGRGLQVVGGFAKEVAKGVVRPFATPFAGVASGVTGRDVQLPGWLGGARGSVDLDEQAKIAGGAALETAALIPAGRGLALLRSKPLTQLGKAEMLQLAKAEAIYGAKTGFAGGAGYELGTQPGATVTSAIESGLGGVVVGGGLGAVSPIAGRYVAQPVVRAIKSAYGEADEVIRRALLMQPKPKKMATGVSKSTTGMEGQVGRKAEEMSEDILASKPLQELSPEAAEMFPESSPTATRVSDTLRIRAKKEGFAEWTPNIISEMSKEERATARRMFDMAEIKEKNPLALHPEEEAAKPFVDQIKHLQRIRQESGAALYGLVDAMPKEPVSLDKPTSALAKWLEENGIKFSLDEQGRPVALSFRGSKFRTSAAKRDREVIKEVVAELFPPRAKMQSTFKTPEEIRTMRQSLRLLLEKQKKATDPFSGEVEGLIGGLRRELNEPLAAMSPEYEKANIQYAIANSGLEDFLKFLGRDFFDATDEEIQKRVGEVLPRLLGNASAKPGTMLRKLREAAEKTGMDMTGRVTDPRRLLYLSDNLDELFNIYKPRGLRGQVQKADEAALEKLGAGLEIATSFATRSPTGLLSGIRKGIRFFRGLGTQTEEQRKILREMLEEGADLLPTIPKDNSSTLQGLMSIFQELKKTGKGKLVDRPTEIVQTPFIVSDEILNIIGSNNPNVSFTRRSLKHLSEKGDEGERLLSLAPDVLKMPDEIRRGELDNRFLFSKEIQTSNKKKPHLVSLEVTEKNGNIIVTSFQTDTKYLEDFELLWRTGSPINRGVPPSAYSLKANAGSRPEFSALKEAQNTPITYKSIIPQVEEKYKGERLSGRDGKDIALGGLAGIEPETDEDGKIKGLGFNPEKAVTGLGFMAGITAGKKTRVGKIVAETISNITTKTLEKLKGRTKVSKQFIQDLTNQPDLKQVERDLLRNILETQPKEVDVPDFVRKVQDELLPLEGWRTGRDFTSSGLFEHITLPKDLRGDIKDYHEIIYKSPIETSAGETHFSGLYDYMLPGTEEEAAVKRYFGHARAEDLPGETRRVIEVQSDLYQKGRLESEMSPRNILRTEEGYEQRLVTSEQRKKLAEELFTARKLKDAVAEKRIKRELDALDQPILDKRRSELSKLQQYNDPTAHFRMIREEVKRAAEDGKTKLQFPTGETAMKVEGLGQSDNHWAYTDRSGEYAEDFYLNDALEAQGKNLIGKETRRVFNQNNWSSLDGESWIITDVLGDGKFKAVPKRNLRNWLHDKDVNLDDMSIEDALSYAERHTDFRTDTETFDISDKIDKENPIYRFYEKEVGKYLKNKYGAKLVTDAQGVTWWELPVKKEWAKLPVEAFGLLPATAALKEEEE